MPAAIDLLPPDASNADSVSSVEDSKDGNDDNTLLSRSSVVVSSFSKAAFLIRLILYETPAWVM